MIPSSAVVTLRLLRCGGSTALTSGLIALALEALQRLAHGPN